MRPILEKLRNRIFSVRRLETGTFLFREECDQWFAEELTREEVIALSRELEELANE